MAKVSVMLAEGNQSSLDCLFSRDWPQAFIRADIAEATRLPIFDSVQSYQTPFSHINCTRAIRALVMPVGFETPTPIFLSVLEREIAPYPNIPIIMGRPQVAYFVGFDWPNLEPHEPLVRLDFSPRHAYTFPFPGTLAMHETMAAGLGGFHNYSTPPLPPPPVWSPSAYTPHQHQVVDFPQVGYNTFAPSATAGELSREEQTRIWVEDNNANNINNNNNAPSGDVVDG